MLHPYAALSLHTWLKDRYNGIIDVVLGVATATTAVATATTTATAAATKTTTTAATAIRTATFGETATCCSTNYCSCCFCSQFG